MNHDYYVDRCISFGHDAWAVLVLDLSRDGKVSEYVIDILPTKEQAIVGMHEARQREILWDHYEAFKLNT